MMKRNDLFNVDGDREIEKRRLIKGNTTNLYELNNIKYEWAMKLYRALMNNFWIPEEIPLGVDQKDYKALSDSEKNGYDKVLSFLVFLDSLQTANLPNFSSYITAPEVNLCLTIQAYQEAIHCFEDGTEILTSEGFKDFNDLTYEDLVANYWEGGSVDFFSPKEIIKSDYKGEMITFKNNQHSQSVTPNHRVVTLNAYDNDRIRIKEASEISVHNHRIPVSGLGKGDRIDFTPLDRLYVAFQADGLRCNPSYDGPENGFMLLFHFKKQRKIDRLLSIVEDGGFKCTVKNHKGYDGEYTNLYVWSPVDFDKEFSLINLSELHHEWCREFIEELTYWDGCRSGGLLRYTNSNKRAVDKTIAVASLCGMRAGVYTVPKGATRPPIHDCQKGDVVTTKDHYQVTYSKIDYVSGRTIEKGKKEYEGKIHCVTVPSGMVIIRHNGKVTVSGNSQSYGYILDTSVTSSKREKIYNYWRDDETLKERNLVITSAYEEFVKDPTDQNFLKAVMANYILEGIYFYSGFLFFYTLARQNKMCGTAQVIRYIQRDELCFIEGTEVLTDGGWVSFQDLDKTEKVAQFNLENGEVDFVKPLAYIDREYEGLMYDVSMKNGTYKSVVTEGHDLALRRRHEDSYFKNPVEKTKFGVHRFIPVAGIKKDGVNISLTDYDRFRIAFQADGTFDSKRKGEISGFQVIKFGLKKERKRKRLEELCTRLGFEYSVRGNRPDGLCYYYIKVSLNKIEDRTLDFGKSFEWISLETITDSWGREFVEELMLWDGHDKSKNIIYYSSTDEQAVSTVQAIGALSGLKITRGIQVDNRKESYKDVHRLYIYRNSNEVGTQSITSTPFDYKGKVYCVTVPTGAIITRYNGKVTVSGNCHLVIFQNIFNELKRENPEMFTPENVKMLRGLMRTAVENEISWGQYVIKDGILGLNDVLIDSYIKYLSNQRMKSIGLEILYPEVTKHPLEWVESFSNVNSIKTDFFEAKPAAYSKSSAVDWDDFDL